MIVFDLRCDQHHGFEAWFASSFAYEDQRTRRLIACPYCSSTVVEKAVMAPRLSTSDAPDPAATMAKLAGLQRKMLEKSTWVGGDFADKARAMADGETPAGTIHGTATPEETRALKNEGIGVLPLLFPVISPEAHN